MSDEFEPRIIWTKFVFPDDDVQEDDDDDSEEDSEFEPYNDDNSSPLKELIASNQNPFSQLKTYNLWVIHTNFRITLGHVLILNKTEGVESVDIMSPYRMYVSIGVAFEDQEAEIKMAIKNVLLKNYEKDRNRPGGNPRE